MSARKNKNEEAKKEKIDIFSLYKHEKIITLKDDSGNEVKVLFVKPTQGERSKLLEKYVDILSEIREQYLKRDKESNYYTRSIKSLSKQHLIEAIMSYQKAQRTELLDLYPLPDEEKLSDSQKADMQAGIVTDWEKAKLEDLDKMTVEELRTELSTITIEGLSLIESGRQFDLLSIHLMCLNPETREKIFKSSEEVEKVRDKRILDTLVLELNEFRTADSASEVRKVAEDPAFLAVGESAKK